MGIVVLSYVCGGYSAILATEAAPSVYVTATM